MDRRELLTGFALLGVTVACSQESDRSGSGTTRPTDGRAPAVTPAEPAPSALPPAVFALGVASGDPLADRVMLWTRLATDPAAGTGAVADGTVEVAFDVATDDAFEQLVVSDVATARPELAHSLHVDVTGLDPDTWYFYRFRAGDQTSPVGRTRTFPAADATPDQFRFVFASCQDLQWGRYAAWARAAELPDVDAVVFLGDYIYESNFGDLSPERAGDRVWANAEARSLDDYRVRYAQTKADASLQAAHHLAPWVVTFDDHEVSNNYAGDVGQADIDAPDSRDRRLAAYQAWYEHTPIRLAPEPGDQPEDFAELAVHRDFTFGALATLFTIETRQHADVPPCRTDGSLVSDEGPGCDALSDEARSNLGEDQERWLLEGLAASAATWNILANPIMFAGLNLGTADAPAYTRDAWDGYPATRQRVIDAIVAAEVSNPVVVTGDWHASFVLDVTEEPGVDGARTVMPELLVSSISTVLFGTDYSAANPHVRYFVAEHGFALVTVTADELSCEFHYIADVWDADAPVSHVDRWVIQAGTPEARRA